MNNKYNKGMLSDSLSVFEFVRLRLLAQIQTLKACNTNNKDSHDYLQLIKPEGYLF